MVEENTEEPRIEDGRAGIALCWWKRRALRRGHGSWYSSVGVAPALRVRVQPLEAFKKSVEFLQLSSRLNRSTCTKPSPSCTVEDTQKVETTQTSIIVLLEIECGMNKEWNIIRNIVVQQ